MRITLFVHALAGGLGLLTGAIALSATKGGSVHRKVGLLFVYLILTMSLSGAAMAALAGGPWRDVNVPAGLLTAYLATTALTTVRPPSAASRWLNICLMVGAMALGLAMLTFGVDALAGGGKRNGVPAFPFLMFGVVGLLGSVGDFRTIRATSLPGASRLARHLWRMCWALWIAAASFFLGPRARVAKILPDALIKLPVLIAPVLLVLIVMLYWLWRVRIRRTFRHIVADGAAQTV